MSCAARGPWLRWRGTIEVCPVKVKELICGCLQV